MKHGVPSARRMNRGRKAVNPKLAQLVRGTLWIVGGLHIKDLTKLIPATRSQISLAIHYRRNDPKSQMIRAQVEELIKGGELGKLMREKAEGGKLKSEVKGETTR